MLPRVLKNKCTPEQAESMLKTLGKEDLLFSHHGEVLARPRAYARLAELIDESKTQIPDGIHKIMSATIAGTGQVVTVSCGADVGWFEREHPQASHDWSKVTCTNCLKRPCSVPDCEGHTREP